MESQRAGQTAVWLRQGCDLTHDMLHHAGHAEVLALQPLLTHRLTVTSFSLFELLYRGCSKVFSGVVWLLLYYPLPFTVNMSPPEITKEISLQTLLQEKVGGKKG